ncbi:MAG: ATP-binding protein [Bacteroidia bacterium]
MKNLNNYFAYLSKTGTGLIGKGWLSMLQEADLMQAWKKMKGDEKTVQTLLKDYIAEMAKDASVPNQKQDTLTASFIKQMLRSEEHCADAGKVLDCYSALKRCLASSLQTYTTDLTLALSVRDELEIYYDLNLRAALSSMCTGGVAQGKDMEEAQTFLKTLMEHIPHMIFVKDDRELRFVQFNKAGEEFLGYPSHELIGKNDYDFFPVVQADFFTAKDRAVITSGKIMDIAEEPIQTRGLGERWLHTKKIPIPSKNGNAGYLLGISEDITEKRKQEDAIKELNQELEGFSYSVSHDLRAPLRAVNGYIQILLEDHSETLPEEVIRLINIVKYNAGKMENLIDDLLSYSRLGRRELLPSDIDMNDLVEGVIRELSRTGTSVKDRIIIGKLHSIRADYGLIHEVMMNLISNAIKYSSKKEYPEIEISSRTEGGEVLFEVRDNGAGFNMKYAGKLFGIFQRLHRSDEYEGTGVGLAIVKRIISRHGGIVEAHAVVDEGATFTFSLPIQKK